MKELYRERGTKQDPGRIIVTFKFAPILSLGGFFYYINYQNYNISSLVLNFF